MKLLLEFDDYGEHNCDKELEYFINKYPRIVFNLFTVPIFAEKIDDKFKTSPNICFAYHGFNHSTLEFKDLSENKSRTLLAQAEFLFNKNRIPSVKVFRAPYWALNQDVISALIRQNFSHVYTHEDYKNLNYNAIKPVYYNWNLKDNFSEELKEQQIIIAHGHTHNVCGNGLPEVADRIDKFLSINYDNIEFLKVNEV